MLTDDALVDFVGIAVQRYRSFANGRLVRIGDQLEVVVYYPKCDTWGREPVTMSQLQEWNQLGVKALIDGVCGLVDRAIEHVLDFVEARQA